MRNLETDSLSNQNISTALAVGSYTATATRGVIVRLLCDQAAGNGDYTAYITLQVGGAGSAYRVIPITTANAASGVTAIGFVSIPIPVDSGDVLTVYLLGLAGDTVAPDTRVDYYEQDYVRPTVAGRTLNVSATGEAEADMVKISTDSGAADNLESVLDGTGGAALKMGQVTISANINAQGAIDITNAHATGYGVRVTGGSAGSLNQASAGPGQYNLGTTYGQYNFASAGTGQTNAGTANGQNNTASAGTGQYNNGTTQGQWNTASAGPGQINGGTTYGQVNSASAGPGVYDSGSTFGIQSVGGTDPLSANMITAASIATGAIDADAIADNAIDAGAIAADAITAAKIANGAIDAATFAAGAIDAAAIATNAIDADALATDAVNEIVDQVWNEAVADHLGGGSTGAALNGATAPTAAAVADAVWDEGIGGHANPGSTGKALADLAPGAAVVLNADITEIHTT